MTLPRDSACPSLKAASVPVVEKDVLCHLGLMSLNIQNAKRAPLALPGVCPMAILLAIK